MNKYKIKLRNNEIIKIEADSFSDTNISVIFTKVDTATGANKSVAYIMLDCTEYILVDDDPSLRIMKIIGASLAIAALVFWLSIIIWCSI